MTKDTGALRTAGGSRVLQLSRWTIALLALASVAAATQEEFDKGFQLGQQAYLYGLPLVIMNYTYANQTSTVPVNQFNYMRQFATPADTLVVAPNFDTLYATAWVDLSRGPVVLHIPNEVYSTVNNVQNRFWVVAMYDPYTNNFKNIGSVTGSQPGDYTIYGPGNRGGFRNTPKEWTIDTDYNLFWIIERIYAINDNAADVQFVNSLQDKITLTPKSNYFSQHPSTSSGAPVLMPTGMAFYDQLCDLLWQFPPPSADYNYLLTTLSPLGCAPHVKPSENPFLAVDTVAGLVAAVSNGTATVRNLAVQMYFSSFAAHNGYLLLPTGIYGTNYNLRAVVTQIGLGALTLEHAIYPIALFDRTAKPLLGFKKYKITIPAGGLPPVNGFWSVTMYTSSGFLVPNSINRYLINDRSTLYTNPDGSIDIYIQPTAPEDPNQAQNWLPTPPAAAFQIIWRLYATEASAIPGIMSGAGWEPPAIMPVA